MGAPAADVPAARAPELVAVAIAFLLPVLFVTSFTLSGWAPRYLATLVVAAAGITAWPLMVARHRWAGGLALGFAAWAGLATLAAPGATVAFWGRYGLGTGWVFDLSLVGAFALGTSVRSPWGRRLVERALLAACLVNVAVAAAQQIVDLSALGLTTYQGRSAGLYGNPVYLAEILAGGLWLGLVRLDQDWRWPTAGVVTGLALGVSLTGSRFGLGLAAIAVAAVGYRAGWRRGLAAAALVALGLALGGGLQSAGRHPGTTALSRSEVAPAGGIRPRLESWRAGGLASLERPVVGWGPSGFLAATSRRRTLALARSEGPDRLFGDAHDVIVEVGVTTGLPGLGLFLGWLGVAFRETRRRVRSPLVGFALLVLGMTLVEPLHVGVTPLALLALGAAAASAPVTAAVAAPALPEGRRPRRLALRLAGAALTVAGVGAAAVVGTGLIALRRAELAPSAKNAAHATRLVPQWSEPAAEVGRLLAFRAIVTRNPTTEQQALTWLKRAASRDPADPAPWVVLGDALRADGQLVEARAALQHALARDPWSRSALFGLARVESATGDGQGATELRGRADLLAGA